MPLKKKDRGNVAKAKMKRRDTGRGLKKRRKRTYWLTEGRTLDLQMEHCRDQNLADDEAPCSTYSLIFPRAS